MPALIREIHGLIQMHLPNAAKTIRHASAGLFGGR
jgi:hypothetical protein